MYLYKNIDTVLTILVLFKSSLYNNFFFKTWNFHEKYILIVTVKFLRWLSKVH